MANSMKLFLELGAKTAALTRGLSRARGSVSGFTANAKREFAQLKAIAGSMHGQLAAMGLGLGAGKVLKDSASLDKQLTRIGQTAQTSGERVRTLRMDLFGMARKSGQGVDNLKDGFNDLVQAGLDMNKSTAALEAMNIAMAVTGATAKTLAGGLTVGAEQFKIDLAQPGKALEMLDKMTAAGRLGNAELEDLSSIFSRVGSNAKRANLEFDQTLALVESLSLVERQPERLATLADSTLRIFTNERYMRAAQKASQVSFFNKDKSRRNAIDILADIKKKYDTFATDMDRFSFIQNAFGKADLDTIKGIDTLLSGDALNRLGRFSHEISSAGGTLQRDFDEATSNLIDQTGMLKNDLREAADGFVTPINETMANVIKWMRDSKTAGGLGLDGKDMIIGGGLGLAGTALLARYGGKAASGLAGKLLKSGGSLATGIATGKAVEKLTGVVPVFVTNWQDGGLGSAGAIPGAAAKTAGGKGGMPAWLKNMGSKASAGIAGYGATLTGSVGSAGMLTTGGSVAGAGLAGYGAGKGINWILGKLLEYASDGKYSGPGALGSYSYDIMNPDEKTKVQNNINLHIAIDEANRIFSMEDEASNTTVNVQRGDFMAAGAM